MTAAKPDDQRLYADLTRLLTKLRNEPLATVENVIEERFRAHLRAGGDRNQLQITLTWALPEGANSWAMYGTEYNLVTTEPCRSGNTEPEPATSEEQAGVIPFPARKTPETQRTAAGRTACELATVVPFPSTCSTHRTSAQA